MRKLYVGRKHRTKEIMLICINNGLNDITAINPGLSSRKCVSVSA